MNYGVEKKVDNQGRIVLPKNMREYYDILLGDKIKLIPTEQGILISKTNGEKVETKDK